MYTENHRISLKEKINTEIIWKTYHAYELEYIILLRWQYKKSKIGPACVA